MIVDTLGDDDPHFRMREQNVSGQEMFAGYRIDKDACLVTTRGGASVFDKPTVIVVLSASATIDLDGAGKMSAPQGSVIAADKMLVHDAVVAAIAAPHTETVSFGFAIPDARPSVLDNGTVGIVLLRAPGIEADQFYLPPRSIIVLPQQARVNRMLACKDPQDGLFVCVTEDASRVEHVVELIGNHLFEDQLAGADINLLDIFNKRASHRNPNVHHNYAGLSAAWVLKGLSTASLIPSDIGIVYNPTTRPVWMTCVSVETA